MCSPRPCPSLAGQGWGRAPLRGRCRPPRDLRYIAARVSARATNAMARAGQPPPCTARATRRALGIPIGHDWCAPGGVRRIYAHRSGALARSAVGEPRPKASPGALSRGRRGPARGPAPRPAPTRAGNGVLIYSPRRTPQAAGPVALLHPQNVMVGARRARCAAAARRLANWTTATMAPLPEAPAGPTAHGADVPRGITNIKSSTVQG